MRREEFVGDAVTQDGAATRDGVERPVAVFGALAEDYARFRPTYPEPLFDAIWERLTVVPPRALDLAAGAGAGSIPLAARGARVVAVEPAPAMLGHAQTRLAGRWVGGVAARAEALPFGDGVADLVTVAQAFHWFEPGEALGEIARALSAGGILAVYWNVLLSDDFTGDVGDLVTRWNRGYGRPVTQKMRATPDALAAHRHSRSSLRGSSSTPEGWTPTAMSGTRFRGRMWEGRWRRWGESRSSASSAP